MFIQSEETPNPSAMKFIPGEPVLEEGTAFFTSMDDAQRSPLAKRLFLITGVSNVFLGSDFIVVSIENPENWETMKPKVIASIMDHYMADMPIMEDEQQWLHNDVVPADETEQQILDLLNERVRPFVEMDGGGINYRGFKDGIVYIELVGSCVGCGSMDVTLKAGIENMLKYYVPEVVEVVNGEPH